MAGEWTKMSFDQCADLVRDTVHPSEVSGRPYIGLEHISEGQLSLSGYGSADQVTSIKSRFQKGDILFGKLRPYFRKVVIATFDGVCSTDIWVVRHKRGIDQRYLFYWMASPDFIEESTRASEGTKMPRAQWEFVGRITKLIPPLQEQRAIAHILGTLDGKIELNRRMSKTLEEMARAIFKSWFVDFDPVRANMERKNSTQGHQEARAQSGEETPPFLASSHLCGFALNPEIARLFPDSFEDSELGKIPRGWIASTIGQNFHIVMGQSPPGNTYNEIGNGMPFYQGRTDFGFRYPSHRVFCTAPTRLAEPGDTLVSVRAPVGDVNMASEQCAIGRGVAAIRHHSGSRSFTYYLVHQLGEHFLKFEAEGTVFGCINKLDFERLPFIVPSQEILYEFDRRVSPIDDKIEIIEKQTKMLVILRDTLLPKLISGELRVKDAERIVGRCT